MSNAANSPAKFVVLHPLEALDLRNDACFRPAERYLDMAPERDEIGCLTDSTGEHVVMRILVQSKVAASR